MSRHGLNMPHYAPDFCTRKAKSNQMLGFGANIRICAPATLTPLHPPSELLFDQEYITCAIE